MKRIPVLPTLLTLGNGVCGLAAIAFASKVRLDGSIAPADVDYYFLVSALLILLGMVFDVLDGYAARISRSSSDFGAELDSLCDAVTFGAAPAFLLLRLGQEWLEQEWQASPLIAQVVAVIAAVYFCCAVLRLARFNVEKTPETPGQVKRFKGLPSPAAAGCVVSLVVLRSSPVGDWWGIGDIRLESFVLLWAPPGTLVAGLLMVSRFSYPHFGRQLLRGRRSLSFVVQAILVLAIVALSPHIAFFVLFWAYALSAPLRSLFVTGRRRRSEPEVRLH